MSTSEHFYLQHFNCDFLLGTVNIRDWLYDGTRSYLGSTHMLETWTLHVMTPGIAMRISLYKHQVLWSIPCRSG